jgi:outer membrane protein TolC
MRMMKRFRYTAPVAVITAALIVATPSLAFAASNNCASQSQQVSSAERQVQLAENTLNNEVNRYYQSQSQLENRALALQSQVETLRYEAQVVRSFPASYFGLCWGWNIWGTVQCSIARNIRRNRAIDNADIRANRAQLQLENFVRSAQRSLERQAQRVVQAQGVLALRKQQLDQANAALAACQQG